MNRRQRGIHPPPQARPRCGRSGCWPPSTGNAPSRRSAAGKAIGASRAPSFSSLAVGPGCVQYFARLEHVDKGFTHRLIEATDEAGSVLVEPGGEAFEKGWAKSNALMKIANPLGLGDTASQRSA